MSTSLSADPVHRPVWLAVLPPVTAVLAFLQGPWPMAECGLAAAFILTLIPALRRREWPDGITLPAWAGALSILVGIGQRPDLSGLMETMQLSGLFILGTLVFRTPPAGRTNALRAGLVAGWFGCLASALLQAVGGQAPELTGGTFPGRALFGILMAATAPLVCLSLREWFPRKGDWLTGMALLTAGMVTFYLPAFILLTAGCLSTAVLCLTGRARWILAGTTLLLILLVAAGLTPWENRQALLQSVATHDPHGLTRRWVLESTAAARAIADRPLFGHGPGGYQAVVSSGQYRSFLPPTGENRVEPGTQCGYLVLAVEYGLLPPLCLCLLLLGAANRAGRETVDQQHRDPLGRAVSLGCLIAAAGQFFTQTLVIGGGVLVLALAGLSPARSFAPAASPSLWQRSWFQSAALALSFTAALLFGFSRYDSPLKEEGAPHERPSLHADVVFEAESAAATSPLFSTIKEPLASAGLAVAVADLPSGQLPETPPLSYSFSVNKQGIYRTWFRTWWRDGCSNSIALRVNESPLALVGNDGTYGAWHWVSGPDFTLEPGGHQLFLAPREGGVRIDQIILSKHSAFYPAGIFSDTGIEETPPTKEDQQGVPPVWLQQNRPEKKSFRIGIGGAYGVGAEAYIFGMGLPYSHLRQEELFDPEALSRYDIIWLAGPQREIPRIWPALCRYVTEGGTLIFEVFDRFRGMGDLAPLELLAPYQGFHSTAVQMLTVKGDNSPLFQGTPEVIPVQASVCYWPLVGVPPPDTVTTHGQVFHYGNLLGPAIIQKKLGKGQIYLLPLPIGFCALRGQRDYDSVAYRLLQEAVGTRYQPLLTELKWQTEPAGEIHFADDFMRDNDQGSAWTHERGTFALTGAQNGDSLAFSLSASGNASTVTGHPQGMDYRVSAAVLADQGAAGVWLSTSHARRLALIYDGVTDQLMLTSQSASEGSGEPTVLRSAPAPNPNRGWRRLSLLRRNREWECWIDGRCLIREPAPEEETIGPFGLTCPRGNAHLDDVNTCSVSALLPRSDRVLGEEGSARALPPFTVGLEPRTLYAPTWPLRPDPEGRHAVRMRLPTYGPSTFRLNGQVMGTIPGDREGPLVYLPEGDRPRTSLEVICPLWSDYTFRGRPADWYDTGEPWRQQSRWSCDPQWVFFGVTATNPSILWHRGELRPPYALSVLIAPTTSQPPPQAWEQSNDLNLVICGNGEDLKDGYTIRVNSLPQGGCSLWQGEELLLENREVGLPYGLFSLHHLWIALTVIVEEQGIRFFYEDTPTLIHELPAPLPAGRVGFWTRNNTIRIARATLSRSE